MSTAEKSEGHAPIRSGEPLASCLTRRHQVALVVMRPSPSKHSSEIDTNLRNHTFFHGAKNTEDLASIIRDGFRAEFYDEDGRWFRDGNLGVGIYLSCDWRTALWFGPVLLRATLLEGTRVFDASPPPERACLDGLVRRFGREILTATDFRRVIPTNKSLRLEEFTALFRHHYRNTWPTTTHALDRWRPRRVAHARALEYCVSHLKRIGYHGFGHPADDNGIVIFQPERITLEEVVAVVPRGAHDALLDSPRLKALTIEELRQGFTGPRNNSG